jgi:hypothetical protein
MNSQTSQNTTEARWRTYLRGATFSIPALVILSFISIFLLPKLETIWRDAGFGAPSAITAVHVAYFVTRNLLIIGAAFLAVLVFLEWRSTHWPRYRKTAVDIAAFLTNTAVLVFITIMFMTAMLAAPALLRGH